MTIQDALTLYNLPYVVTATTNSGNFTIYHLQAAGAQATINRLSARLQDISASCGLDLELLQDRNGISLRSKNSNLIYDWFNYNGYIDFTDINSPFIVGMGSNGIITDTIDHCPHLLIAGTTGSGKSVFLHSFLTTMICNPINQIGVIDCKRVEFSMYRDYINIAYDVFGEQSAACMTASIVYMMQERYKLMERLGVNNFKDLLRHRPDIKRVILIIDELAELLQDKQSKKIIMPRLLSIAQLGRAAGIHLIAATQRPDTKIINGTLKANIPTRCAFHSITNTDSRVILDRGGAERLTGNGDMLYLRNGAQSLERIQALYINPDQIKHDILKVA